MDSLASKLKAELGPDTRIIRLMNANPEDRETEGLPSAVGNYLNFLRLGECLYLPQYGIEEDDDAAKTLLEALPGLRLVRIEATALARLGGVLNCTTWAYLERKDNFK